ncbi:MAG: ATP-dependent DNA helicase [Pseudomonadales bacterium]|nr:ATP-dependent DNA helicase [Pseudomonadales bacterium]
MAVGVYRALSRDEQLIVQAPTGLGKTVAALFPALKVMGEGQYEKVFYVTARTSGQRMAEATLAGLRGKGLMLRDVTITAKDKVCFNPGSPCEPEHCEYARGYYDRLPAAIDGTLASHASLTRSVIEDRSRAFNVCPFEFSLDLSRYADVIICDYNYVFDPAVYLRRYFDESSGDYALLIDECHNLVDRGRDMFSALVTKGDVLAVRRLVKSTSPLLAKRLARINSEILALKKEDPDGFQARGYIVGDEVPAGIVRAMRGFCDDAEDWLQREESGDEALLDLYFDCLRFIRTSELFDRNYVSLLISTGRDMILKLYCVDPAPLLRRGLERVKATVGFSATVTPRAYFRQLLGVGEETGWYRLPSPFASENLGVFVANHISTAWKDRDRTLGELTALIEAVTRQRRGNYLIFFPSYAYLQAVHEEFQRRWPEVDTIVQQSGMSEGERDDFLGAFEVGEQHLIGFAVMGGVFGEGVDLKGTRLIGVIIAGVGIPQVGIERDLIRDYFDESGQGFEFAYQFPGMNRVLQTAGRVIRDESDRGIVCLVDSRFSQARYRQLYPPEWNVSHLSDTGSLTDHVSRFWRGHYGVTSDGARRSGDDHDATRRGHSPGSACDGRSADPDDDGIDDRCIDDRHIG